jgi:hypothetical protein
LLLSGCATTNRTTNRPEADAFRTKLNDPRFRVGELLFRDDFTNGLARWTAELESGGVVEARDGQLIIDVPGGCSVWFKPLIAGPVLIEYEATVIQAGATNDRVSDLNCFWMARDARSPDDLFATSRSGKFADYDSLRCYYVGLGGNANTTTRFRRYIGQPGNRPLLPEHDLTAPEFLLKPNVPQRIQLVACGSDILYFRDGRKLFGLHDPEPYTSGWFAFRTVKNHLAIRNFRVFRLVPAAR